MGAPGQGSIGVGAPDGWGGLWALRSLRRDGDRWEAHVGPGPGRTVVGPEGLGRECWGHWGGRDASRVW